MVRLSDAAYRDRRAEQRLAKQHLQEHTLVLYDLTSSYLEGTHCPLAQRGHSRDGKQGTLQIVFGLLCTAAGCPVAVEVFEGSTSDPKTVACQVDKLRTRFGLQRVVLVGDRGMLTAARIREDLAGVDGLRWITTLRAPTIRKLLAAGTVTPSLFDERDLAEVTSELFPGERLVVCRNPLLAAERQRKRQELLAATEKDLAPIAAATTRQNRLLRGAAEIGMRVGKVINVGDVGDFVKYGLLRAIRGSNRLGVAWYLHPDAGPPGDGGHTAYLRNRDEWRDLDPRLFDTLTKLISVGSRRAVRAIQESGILGDAAFAADLLDVSGLRVRDRECWRHRWFSRVQDQLAGCDIVFADPDNGLVPNDRFRPARQVNAKRIPFAEATALAKGRTAVIYHHNSRRRGGHLDEIRWLKNQLPDGTIAYYWRRVSNRTFFIINPAIEVRRRLHEFVDRWGDRGQLV